MVRYVLDTWLQVFFIPPTQHILANIFQGVFQIPFDTAGACIDFMLNKIKKKKPKPNILPVKTNHLPKDFKMLAFNTHWFNAVVSGLINGGITAPMAKYLYECSFFEWWRFFTITSIISVIQQQWYAIDFMVYDAKRNYKNDKDFKLGNQKEARKLSLATDIVAVNDGVVVWTSNTSIRDSVFAKEYIMISSYMGNHVIIMHAPGEYSVYAHLQTNTIKVSTGDIVKQGQVIGKLGNTGNSSTPHLHFHMSFTAPIINDDGFVGLPLINFNYKAIEFGDQFSAFTFNSKEFLEPFNQSIHSDDYKTYRKANLTQGGFVKEL